MSVFLVADSPSGELAVSAASWRSLLSVEVVTATTPQRLFTATSDPPSAIVLEEVLEWAEPQAVLRELRERFPLCPAILVTAGLNEAALAEWVALGVDDYVRQDDLVRLPLALRGALERARLRVDAGQAASAAASSNGQVGLRRVSGRSDERYQAFVAQSTEGLWCFELDQPLAVTVAVDEQVEYFFRYGYLAECNDALARMYGYTSAADLLGIQLNQLLDRNDPRNEAYLRAFVEAGYRLVDAESHEHDRDGNERVFLNSLVGTVVDNHLVRAWGLQRDITIRARDEREQQLRAATGSLLAEALVYEVTLANVARLLVPELADYCLIHILDQAGGYQQLTGVHRDPAVQPLLDRLGMIYRPDISNPTSILGRVVHTGEALFSPEATVEQARSAVGDNEILAIYRRLDPRSYMIVPLLAREQIRGTITLARTAARQPYEARDLALANELAHRCAVAIDNAMLYRQAQEAIKARDQLLTIASHELRTPLTAILGFASVLQHRNERNPLLAPRDVRVLTAISEQGARLERLLNLVLDHARIETGQLAIEHVPLDLTALIHNVAAQLEPTLENHRLAVDIWPTPLMVQGDALRLEQAIQQLLLNAVKYSPSGGTITIALRPQGQLAQIMISDEGIGVPADDLPRLGQRFFRASNANPRQISGAGIGLYVVREVVYAHSGTLQIESAEGQGTVVRVDLPLAAQHEEA